jgi:hypothetical protein
MKKFKSIFYPIYLVVVVLVLTISFNIFESLELFKKWGLFKYFSDLPYMARDLLIFLSALMVIELIAENVHLFSIKGKIAKYEEEITNLKARLYDQKGGSEPSQEEEDEGGDSSEEDED